jgi:hypothetical protein
MKHLDDMNVDEFLAQAAGHGPCLGIHRQTTTSLVSPAGVEVRTIDGARTKNVYALFDAFAELWHFPPWFGRNSYAFDDFMRDLDNIVNTATGRPPASGYLTDIPDAHLLLVDEPEAFPWFVHKVHVYRDYYRDVASPPAAFGLLLSAPRVQLDQVHERLLATGIQVATVTV